jgi:hypothetical protein
LMNRSFALHWIGRGADDRFRRPRLSRIKPK